MEYQVHYRKYNSRKSHNWRYFRHDPRDEKGFPEILLAYRRIWLISLVPISFFLRWVTHRHPYFTEKVFAGCIYKYYAIGLGSITGNIPFSLMECAIVFAPFLMAGLLVWFIIGCMKRKGRRLAFCWKWIASFAAFGSFIFFWLTLMCSVNYNRYTFAEISGLNIQDTSKEELYELCLDLAERANALRVQLGQDEDGAFALSSSSIRELAKTAQQAYIDLAQTYPEFGYPCPPSKPIHFSRVMSYTDLTGVYCPFTMETNINTDVADYSIPLTICHELAHYYGFMREDEANFIGYLACMCSDSKEFQYSGTMLALIHAGNQLSRADADLYHALWEQYTEEISTDLEKNREYWDQFRENKVTEVSVTLNDSYLKANHQEDGVESYGRMVDLLLAEYRKQKK